jgi:hypothetical protein
MVGKIKDRKKIELWDHLDAAISTCRFHMLAKRIAIAHGSWPWHRREQPLGSQRHASILKCRCIGRRLSINISGGS